MDRQRIPRLIDLSCVKTEVTMTDLRAMVELAKKYRFICCFAMPCYTGWLLEQLREETDILVGGTAGFPSGADMTGTKVDAARRLARMGCGEIDMVMNVSALKSGDYAMVEDDIRQVREAVGELPLKVILEVSYLNDEEIRRGSELAVRGGAAYVKTGTGWAPKPTTVEHIRLIRSVVGDAVKIKAAGGIRTLRDIEEMCAAGCSRFGIGLRSARSILAEAGLHA